MKLAGVVPPLTEPVTEYDPATVLAANTALAFPSDPVPVVNVLVIDVNVPLGPLPGAANITVAAFTGLPKASATNATSGLANVDVTVALCPDPENTLIDAGVPARTFKVKFCVASGGTPLVALIVIG